MTALFTNPLLATLMLILGFGFLIFVHELGHFLVAKWVGIRATQFAVGFGQALVAYRKGIGVRVGSTESEYRRRTEAKLSELGVNPATVDEKRFYEAADSLGLGETEYRLNWVPLGGYVKMLGQEDMDPNAQSDDPRAFNRKPIWARACVISAGVVVNLIVGMIFLIIAFSDYAGVNFPSPVVGFAEPGMPAATTYAQGHEGDENFRGLRTDDRVLEVNGKTIEDLVAVRIASALGSEGEPVELTIEREGVADPLTYRITAVPDERQEGMLTLGVGPAQTLDIAERLNEQAWSQTAWGQGGATPGMRVVSIDGELVTRPGMYRDAVNASMGLPITVGFANPNDDSQTATATDTPELLLARNEDGASSLLGLIPATVIAVVGDDSPAAAAGLQAGDVVSRLGSRPYPTVEQMQSIIQKAEAPLALHVWRDGQRVELSPVVPRGSWFFGLLGTPRVGVSLDRATDHNYLHGFVEGSALADLNLPAGSRFVSLNGEPVEGFDALASRLQQIAAEAPDDYSATVELGLLVNVGEGTEETVTLTLDQELRREIAQARWMLPTLSQFFTPDEIRVAGETMPQAAALGLAKTGEFVQQTYITLLRLIQGSVKFENLRGPVGIVDAGVTVASRGWPYFLFFLGLISVNLAVINFLPLPIVDGGLMVFLIIEKLRGKPAGPAIQSVTMILGLVLIAGVFLVVTYHDLARLFT
ncbi:MAG: site-2 protease family protein [Planctomycetota bacterium]